MSVSSYKLQELGFHPVLPEVVSEVGRTRQIPPERANQQAKVAGVWMADTALSSPRLVSHQEYIG